MSRLITLLKTGYYWQYGSTCTLDNTVKACTPEGLRRQLVSGLEIMSKVC